MACDLFVGLRAIALRYLLSASLSRSILVTYKAVLAQLVCTDEREKDMLTYANGIPLSDRSGYAVAGLEVESTRIALNSAGWI